MKYDVQQEILQLKKELGAKVKIMGDDEVRNIKQYYKETGTLPYNVYRDENDDIYYTIEEDEIFEKNMNDYLLLSIYKNISSIQNMATFFTVLVALGIFGTLIMFIIK